MQHVLNPGNGHAPKWTAESRPQRSFDELSPFRWFVLRARQRVHKGPTDLSPEYLKGIWIQQNGTCPLTGWSLLLPQGTRGWKAARPCNASLDRIDCSKGYVQGNVRFVGVIANYARNTFSDDVLREFCAAVVNHQAV